MSKLNKDEMSIDLSPKSMGVQSAARGPFTAI